MPNVRTRFAPSPTGYLHVGGVRTALFAWLVARQGGGQFILRLEDTDRKREVRGADQHIIDCLQALGLDHDEGPYRQSERLEIYQKWARRLLQAGRAYADPYSPEQVQAFRDQAAKSKGPFLYRDHRPAKPPAWDGRLPLRFKSEPKAHAWRDEVMGELAAGPEVIDDFVLLKSDGFPTYNFAHIVDDIEMKISHVIRGQEFLASLPNYLNLYEALGIEPPLMATVPHILNEQGNKKLSKRDGAKDVLDYVRDGFLPDALVSFIATLGWNDGTNQEIFTRDELIAKFSLSRVQKSGARFDERRLLWLNGHFIRNLPIKKLRELVENYWPKAAAGRGGDYKLAVLELVRERLKYLGELPELTTFFFEDPPVDRQLIAEHKHISQYERTDLSHWLEQAREELSKSDFSLADLTKRLNSLLAATGQKPAVLFGLIRIATTQAPASPGLAETLAVLGRATVLRRLDRQIAAL